MKNLIVLVVSFLLFSNNYSQYFDGKEKTEILKVLENQRIAWNNGDLEKYMDGYWKSDSLRFIGKSGINYGWDAALRSYKKSYPDKSAMGHLIFEIISLEFLGKESAFMIGKWSLHRNENDLSGHFSLIWRKINGFWLITADHSS